MKYCLHFLLDIFTYGELVQSKQIFLKIEVKVALFIAKSYRIFKFLAFNIGSCKLDMQEPVKVVDHVIEFTIDYNFHVDFNFGLEIIKPIKESPDVTLKGPALFTCYDPVNKSIKGKLLFQLAHIDIVLVIDQTLHNLEIRHHVE